MSDKPKINPLKRGKPAKWAEREPAAKKKRAGLLAGLSRPECLKWVILSFLSILISVLLFPSILTKPRIYRIGDVAEGDIKASRDFLIEDTASTERNRDKAVKEVLAVYDFDRASSNLASRVKEAFAAGREYFDRAFDPETGRPLPTESTEQPSQEGPDDPESIENRFFAILEISPDKSLFEPLLKFDFPPQVEETLIRLITEVSEQGVVGNRAMLKKDIEKGGITLHEIHTKSESTVNDFNRFYDLEGARRYLSGGAETLRKTLLFPGLTDVTIKLAKSLIKPNLTYNQRETEQRKDLVQKSIKPKYFKIKKGEMLVREGEKIEAEHLLKISGENSSRNRVNSVGPVPAMAIMIAALFVVMYLIGLKGFKAREGNRRDILFNASILLAMFVFIWAYNFIAEEVARGFAFFSSRALLFAIPVAFGAMLVSVFQGLAIATCFSLVISVLAALVTGGKIEFFIYCFVSSLVAAYGVRNCNERGILIRTGLLVGFLNIVLSLCLQSIYGTFYTLESIIAATSGFMGGLLAGVIATGILPLIEMSFGFTTNIKLLELANLDQPLLRELMVRAPGTYHHSVITSNMVEATAKAVQANPLLAKVSAYYHDIGKMKKPLYFIENQLGGENRHEKLAPSMSSLILISHVKDGVELAKEHKLGREIIDIIQQHHGTSLISFFYQKARDRMGMKGNKFTEIKEEDFRYPGPKPQTKEAGLVMLADMVEAACRSLVDPTPARIQGMVQNIINKVFSDGQLNECELTLKDLNEIAKSFNKTLSGIFHQRVEYPEMVGKPAKKGKNGNSDQASKEDPGSKKPEDKAQSEKGLRRLGLS